MVLHIKKLFTFFDKKGLLTIYFLFSLHDIFCTRCCCQWLSDGLFIRTPFVSTISCCLVSFKCLLMAPRLFYSTLFICISTFVWVSVFVCFSFVFATAAPFVSLPVNLCQFLGQNVANCFLHKIRCYDFSQSFCCSCIFCWYLTLCPYSYGLRSICSF